MTDVDVIIVGAGPTGLMLAAELRLAGARPLVLERRPEQGKTPKAHGLSGQILDLLHYRGLLDRVRGLVTDPVPADRFPFGGVHVDLTRFEEPPLKALSVRQPLLEGLLEEHAIELGAEVRRGHEVAGVRQDDESVTAEVRGPDGSYEVTALFLVGCDGGRSPVRSMAGIGFPGTTYPEVNRIGQVKIPDGLTVHDNGDIETPELGRIEAGFTRTDAGVFALGSLTPGILFIQTTEDDAGEVDDDVPMTLAELGDSIRRVLGGDVPLGDPVRLSRYQFSARQAERYRKGRILLAGDAAHLLPSTGTAINVGMSDSVNLAWKLAAEIQGRAPQGLLDTYHAERHAAGARALLQSQAQVALRRGHDEAAEALRAVFEELLDEEQAARRLASHVAGTDTCYPMPGSGHALAGRFVPDLALETDQGTTSVAELLRPARPVLLDLAGRPELRDLAQGRVDVYTAKAENRPADVLLIRPDGYVAWAGDTDADGLREALAAWFG
ncbi:FAD-binding monooxygenase [Amycolatopsis sp. WAC 01416]|uniref:FAD-dependent monooxygenase n=1 Tax=Amycolatopsis sp. WAC 01416 TaxID=2203196 RepID=UPI000F79C280|nr:FAD-dependent monooxygenase [Amycolatopsis sp. WAC 01416]RSN30499.1 FAD-binding monooxygenase [Amycolatopsis sp. WAC 01416]